MDPASQRYSNGPCKSAKTAEKLDEERFAAEEAARADEVAQVIAEGA